MDSQGGSVSQLHIVMFPWFGFGHISPFVQLSNKLSSHGVRISFFSASGNIQRISSALRLGPNVQLIPLQIPHVEGIPPGIDSTAEMSPAMAEILKIALDLLQPHVRNLLSTLKPHLVVHDFAQSWLPTMASQHGIKSFFFYVFSAASNAYISIPLRMSKLIGESSTLDEMKNPPPGFPSSSSIKDLKTYEARDLLYIFMSCNGSPSAYDRISTIMRDCTGMIIKSCKEMEGPYIDYFKNQFGKPVLLSGPVVPDPPIGALHEKWAKWLGLFPSKAVIYCSFGSETFLSDEQIKELVLGLEQTGSPFIVVLNFESESGKRLKAALPDGFEERVKGKGLVHTGWVQQQHILAHDSVGCFVTHSGFSSLTEALVNDCQLVLLPMKADQFFCAKLFAGDMRAGVEVIRNDEDGYFRKEDLCMAVKTVMVDHHKMPGRSIRENHEKWRKFMLDKEVHDRFTIDLVQELTNMALKDHQ